MGLNLSRPKAPCTRSLVLDRSRCFPPLLLAENPRPSPLAASKPRSVQATMAPRTVRTAALLLAAAFVLAACFCCCCSGAGGCEGDGRFHAFSLVGHHRVLRQENAPRRRLVRLLPPGVRRRRRQRGGRLQALRRRHARPGAGRPCQGPGRTHGTIAL
jgi:hypothetical protein